MDQAPADRDANAVRSPEDEKPVAQIGWEAFTEGDTYITPYHKLGPHWTAKWEAAATAVRDKVRRETIEECAALAAKWKSPLRPGTEARLLGHQEAAREIADDIRALPSPPCVPDRSPK